MSGVVHHSNYLKFFERGRTEALRSQGFELNSLLDNHGVQFVVHTATLEFLKPARLDQLLSVVTTVETVRKVSVVYRQSLQWQDTNSSPLCVGTIKLACVNKDLKPCAIPPILAMEMKK